MGFLGAVEMLLIHVCKDRQLHLVGIVALKINNAFR
jgi:hypothetical protein